MTRRIGILGGTFDPVHLGHIDVASAGVRALHLSSLVMMPANVPPHRPSPSASPFHRFAMVSLAIADRHGWTASDMELLDPARSFTSATLDRLHVQGYAASELYFLIGVDAFRDIASWKDYPALLDKANFEEGEIDRRTASNYASYGFKKLTDALKQEEIFAHG